MRTIKKIVKPNIKNGKLRVAAYCRVSKDSDSLERSLKTQIDYFRKKIESNNDYEFVRVYFDNGISGTRIKINKKLFSKCDWTRYFAFDNDIGENKYGVKSVDIPIANYVYQNIY